MRALALDIGEKRIGVAVSDPSGSVATPVAVIDARQTLADGSPLARILADYEDIELLVVGLPRTLDGAEGPQAARTREVAERLAERAELPLAFCDERLTSREASRRMAEGGADTRRQRGRLDAVAASILLQTYLDQKRD